MNNENLGKLITESPNPKSSNLDSMSVSEILHLMNEEDEKIIHTIKEVIPQIEKAINLIVLSLQTGGKVFYVGAGTSGRIAIMDAVELLPTFSSNDDFKAIIAGGESAFIKAVEGAEDKEELAINDLINNHFSEKDVVCSIAASGRTPYCIGALKYAKKINAKAISISCNKNSQMSKFSDVAIEVCAGEEILTGSTRLKAGTAQKMILNMISTTSMIMIGKVYKNFMVDMQATNQKLVDRSKRIIMNATNCSEETALKNLSFANGSIKCAIVMILTNKNKNDSLELLKQNKGFVRKCL
ncbi:MAG: N-acetylmuramic acid 6-phosphate etherase [Eubacteriales bacterium]|nr:N-acetylmuramic acid 6-phosphate etherase [Eubacteriales bacterium]